ncbi:hypothetical protein D3C73_381390 [compost metagenome]
MCIGSQFQRTTVFTGHFGVHRLFVVGSVDQQNAGTGECAHAIDVAVGHVAGDVVRIARQPDGFLHAEQPRKDFLHLGLVHAGVAIGVEQHRFGGDQRAFAVNMDRPAFVAQRRTETFKPQVIERAAPQAFVEVVRRLAAPRVEAPAHPGQALLRMADETRAGVAAPAVVHRPLDQFDVRPAQRFGAGDRRWIDNHFHRFETGNGIGHAGEVFLHVGQCHAPSGLPQRLIVRPDHPGRRVPGPLGGHDPTGVFIVVLLHDALQVKSAFQLSHCVQ